MKQILLSLLVVILIIGSVSVSAYALFSSTATVSGLTFSTGNANLEISNDNLSWSDTLSFPSVYTNMSPNFSNSQVFYLKNTSLSNIALVVSAKIIDNSPLDNASAWNVIGDKIVISFQKTNGTVWTNIASGTLQQWKDTGFELNSLAYNSFQKYQMSLALSGIDDSSAGQSLSNLSLQFLGVQE